VSASSNASQPAGQDRGIVLLVVLVLAAPVLSKRPQLVAGKGPLLEEAAMIHLIMGER